MTYANSNHKGFRDKSYPPIFLLHVEFRPDGQAYAIIPLRYGFIYYVRLCESSRIDGIRHFNTLEPGDMKSRLVKRRKKNHK